ncbi:sulfurtransferase [Saccharibacillus sp. CPCC 101409]|uniref:sulfurtransferase n=1 Tax=Saccharibacillus sp. CPCC 101409 TaxID=3058041 RepID=UPI0026724544|nr:sulfurtransferase [Saccharibacillus sp. CPCC 101409]MDO3410432.1 sulfurtransferase [Saccharibacillus sp. CPCC 101409]
MQNIVSNKWLLARLYEPEQTIVDCRFMLDQPESGREAYGQEHIPGAIYFDLKKDLSGPVSEHGGRHPLPDPEEFAARLAKAGIGNDTRVIVYDTEDGMNASRLWWMLRWLGHENVAVLDGGLSAWKKAGFPVDDKQAVRVPASFTPNVQHHLLTDVNEVQRIVGTIKAEQIVIGVEEELAAERTELADETTVPEVAASAEEKSAAANPKVFFTPVLIDSRSHDRYLGQNETMDPVGGHIPGAVNFFWRDLLKEDGSGSFKSKEELEKHFEGIDKDAEIVVYCGSGVSACPNVLALEEAGFTSVRLYAGSWSDWISYGDNPVATGEEV